MTELDIEIPALAKELIDEFGKAVEFGQREPGDYDPATASAAPQGGLETVRAVVEPYRGQRLLAGLVEAGDLKLTVAADSVSHEPTPADIVVIDDVEYSVINVLPTYSGELVAVWEIQIRRNG